MEDKSEELKEDFTTVLRMFSLKYEKLDNETAMALQRIRTQCLPQMRQMPEGGSLGIGLVPQEFWEAIENGRLPVHPGSGRSIDGSILPVLPPVENLNGLIHRCCLPFQKQLTASDVNDGQCRLVFNSEYAENHLLPMLNDDEDINAGVKVTVYGTDGKDEQEMRFKRWGSKFHVLIDGWKSFYQKHGLRAIEDWVTVWMFRHLITGGLCFVITSRRFPIGRLLKRPKDRALKFTGKQRKTRNYD